MKSIALTIAASALLVPYAYAQDEFDTGSRAFRGQGFRPSLRVAAEWD